MQRAREVSFPLPLPKETNDLIQDRTHTLNQKKPFLLTDPQDGGGRQKRESFLGLFSAYPLLLLMLILNFRHDIVSRPKEVINLGQGSNLQLRTHKVSNLISDLLMITDGE